MPLQVTKHFVGMVRKHHPNAFVHFSIQLGPHGFDILLDTEEPRVKKARFCKTILVIGTSRHYD